jgi:putative hydrolase of HD superfamily
MSKNNITPLTNFLFEISSLRKIVRAHRRILLADDLSDNISSHSYLVTWISYVLAKKEGADISKSVLIAMSHDVSESRTGDLGWINKRYTKAFEDEAVADMFGKNEDLEDFVELLEEYDKRQSREAKLVKDADKIAQLIAIKEYIHAYDNKQARTWLDEVDESYIQTFFTETAKEMVRVIVDIKPNDWAEGLATEKRR